MRPISRLASFRRVVFSSAPVAAWKRRLNSSCRVSASRCSSSSSLRSRMSLARKEITTLARHELGLDRELLRVRLVGEDVDPDLPAALDLAGHRDSGGLDLPVGHPAVLERLDAVLAELDRGLTLGLAGAAAAVVLPELRSSGEQHQLSAFFLRGAERFGAPSELSDAACCSPVLTSGASATGFGVSSTCGWIGGCSRPSADAPSVFVRGRSTFVCWPRERSAGGRPEPEPRPRPPPPPGRPWPPRWPGRPRRTGPRPSRSCWRPRPDSRDAPRPSVTPPRRRAVSWSPSRVSRPPPGTPKPSGMISPLLIQTFTPIRPVGVFASTKP